MGKIANISAVIVLLISMAALLGWWSDHAVLAAWLPGIADMTFNTALCFVLVALACLPLSRKEAVCRSFRKSTGLFVGLFATLSLLQDLFGISFGIDNLLFDSHGYGLTSPYPGRMSPATAAGLLFTGIILILLAARKEPGRFTTITHALILLVVLVSLLSIGMNIFIGVASEGYVHFASISLFTAIAFLLLANALAGILQQQLECDDAELLLYSGIRLMYRLKYPQKFALISMCFVIPLAILMWDEISMAEQDVAHARLKITGIEHIRKTAELFKAIPEHRGMTNANFANPDLFREPLKQKAAQIDRLFADSARMDQLHVRQIPVSHKWTEILSRWASIKEQKTDPLIQWRLHTEIIALLANHLRYVGEASRLSFDESPLLHNLLAAQLEVMPELFEQIGQLRGQGSGFMARKTISRDEQIMLGAMASRIKLSLQALQQLLERSLEMQGLEELLSLYSVFTDRTRRFVATAEQQLIADGVLSISSKAYFQQATAAIEQGYALNDAVLKYIEQQLQQRIIDRITVQYNIKLAAILLFLLLLFLFAAFYQSVMNTIQALDKAALRMKGGDVNELSRLPASDELGDVVSSFNTIAGELMRVSSYMSAVVDHAGDGIITMDADGTVQSFNPAAEQVFGYTRDEVIGQNITMLIPEVYRERHQAGLQHYRETGEGVVIDKIIEVHGLKKDGSEFPMELSINTMQMDGQQMFIGMVRDATEQQKMEHQLRHVQKMEAVGALVGGVAHNFNNLLAGIIGKAYLAKMKARNAPQITPHLEAIEDISKQAGEMVKQLLTFSRKDFFQDKQEMPLGVLIKEGFKTAKLGVAEDIDLSLNIAAPDMMVNCDANQIQQVLMNMINNARDAVADSDVKSIAVTLDRCRPNDSFFHRHPELKRGDYACLAISDTGHGMDAETVVRVFEPFYTTKEVGEGTGLGLSTAYGSITSHHGVIEVDSSVGKGTTFRVYLPLIEEAMATDSDDSGNQSSVRSARHEMLLLVDDEMLIIEAMQGVLEELGYTVVTARDGVEGLERFKQYRDRIAAIITDVTMPRMSGVEMFRQIRHIHATVPTVFVTGYDEGNVQLHTDERENTTVVSKPVQVPELSRLVQALLRSTTACDTICG